MCIDCPQQLNEDARQAWREVLAEMDRRGIAVLEFDRTALTVYCTTHARWAQHAQLLAEHGSKKTGEQSDRVSSFDQAHEQQLRQNIARESWDLANTYAAIFFLSPADRIRIHNISGASIPRRRRPGGAAGRSGAQA